MHALIDLLTLQTISVIIAAASVVIYIVNLFLASRREERNKRITLSNNILQSLLSEEGAKRFAELLNTNWIDFNDYQKKYDSTVNVDHFAKRYSLIVNLDLLGYLLRNKLVEPEIIYNSGGFISAWMWVKFKSVIEEYRKIAYGHDAFREFEYLANEMWRMKKERDPTFLTDQTYFPSDAFEKTFNR